MFYKTKRTLLNERKVKDVPCPNCGTIGSIRIAIYRDVSWQRGPFGLPSGASPEIETAECLACKTIINSKNISPDLRVKLNQLSAVTETPYRFFFGPIF